MGMRTWCSGHHGVRRRCFRVQMHKVRGIGVGGDNIGVDIGVYCAHGLVDCSCVLLCARSVCMCSNNITIITVMCHSAQQWGGALS